MNENHSNVWVFADVDDNLITTVRTQPEPGAEPCSWDSDGRVCGFLTNRQRSMNALLASGANVVPTTARSYVGRLDLGFSTGDGSTRVSAAPAATGSRMNLNGYAILANGGTILGPDGNRVRGWFEATRANSMADSAQMNELKQFARSQAEQRGWNMRTKVVTSKDLELYVSVKHNDKNQAELVDMAQLLAAVTPTGWQVHHNANAIFIMPEWLGKEKAVAWFIANILPADAVTIGMGDSLSDLSFMNLCDYALMPRRSQNWPALLQALNRR